jgi:hypothetical protein
MSVSESNRQGTVTARHMVPGWAWFSKAAHDRALSAGGDIAGSVYIGLCKRQSDAGSKGKVEFFASIANIARAAGVSTRAVSKYIPLLEKCRLIARISGRHGGIDGAHCANRWMILQVDAPGTTRTPARGTEGLPAAVHKLPSAVRKHTHAKQFSRANKEELLGHTGLEGTSPPTPTAAAGVVSPAPPGVAEDRARGDKIKAGQQSSPAWKAFQERRKAQRAALKQAASRQPVTPIQSPAEPAEDKARANFRRILAYAETEAAKHSQPSRVQGPLSGTSSA